MHPRRWVRQAASFVALALVAGACTAANPEDVAQPALSAQSPAHSEATATQSPSATDTPSATPSLRVETVTIAGISFMPQEITVPVGELTFVNTDDVPHTVTEGQNGVATPGARFDELIRAGETIVITLDTPGDYQITCQFHAQMHLLVHVR